MPRPLIDLLWRDHADAPVGGRRGPRARYSTGDVVERAIALADESGIAAVTVRALAQSLELTAMSVYTHVNSRVDLLVLMADRVHARMPMTPFGRAAWRTRVPRVADDNLALYREHAWLLDVDDPRTALGPGTIAKYDRELHAFDGTALDDVDRDAALTFVLDWVRSAARRIVGRAPADDFEATWLESEASLACYVGDDFALARRVGRAAGEAMGGPYDAERAWTFGLDRIIAGLGDLDRSD
ncbi:MAG TPA: TetR/AcrR family transcriptional regulator C-terminal domain-containing protein [Agromyces sp.]